MESGAWGDALLATLFISIAPVLILPCIPISSTKEGDSFLKVLLSFAIGGLLGDVFLHLLPHAQPHKIHEAHEDHNHENELEVGEVKHDHSTDMSIGLWVMAGILVFFCIEKYIRSITSTHSSHSHTHSHQQTTGGTTPTGYLNLIADASHNFTDGLAIGASFLASKPVGISTTIAVFFHEIPHEIGDYAILIQSGFSKRNAMLAQLVTAIGALFGTICGLASEQISESTLWILPFTAGINNSKKQFLFVISTFRIHLVRTIICSQSLTKYLNI
jgi:zinc transporter 7